MLCKHYPSRGGSAGPHSLARCVRRVADCLAELTTGCVGAAYERSGAHTAEGCRPKRVASSFFFSFFGRHGRNQRVGATLPSPSTSRAGPCKAHTPQASKPSAVVRGSMMSVDRIRVGVTVERVRRKSEKKRKKKTLPSTLRTRARPPGTWASRCRAPSCRWTPWRRRRCGGRPGRCGWRGQT